MVYYEPNGFIQHFICSQGSGMESIGFVLRRKNADSISTIPPNLPLKRETYQHLQTGVIAQAGCKAKFICFAGAQLNRGSARQS